MLKIIKFRYILIYCIFPFVLASKATARDVKQNYQRVICLAPSLTEFLYEFNLGDKIVGVTRFCEFPEQARSKPSIGGLLDPNFEMIYRLNPDLILYNEGATSHKKRFEQMHFNTLETKSTSINGILDCISTLGEIFDKVQKAKILSSKIRAQIMTIKLKTKNLPKPTVMVTYWRELGMGKIAEAYIAGNDTFFNDLINICGGKNVYQEEKRIVSPIISAEGILQMNPDVIIEIKGTLHQSGYTVKNALSDWNNLNGLKAYKNNNIFILHSQYIGIPGPRIGLTIRDIARCLHPAVNWNE